MTTCRKWLFDHFDFWNNKCLKKVNVPLFTLRLRSVSNYKVIRPNVIENYGAIFFSCAFEIFGKCLHQKSLPTETCYESLRAIG